jgi:Flp pilus assembly protein TadG
MLRAFRDIAVDNAGVAVMELALIAPVLAVFTIGLVDLSNAYSQKLALEQGAQRAIEKIMQTTSTDTVEGTLATEAVCQVNGQNADNSCKTGSITTDDVSVTWRRECTDEDGNLTVTQAGNDTPRTYTTAAAYDADSCDDVSKEASFIQLTITDHYKPLFPIHFAGYNSAEGGYDISATAGMRTQ